MILTSTTQRENNMEFAKGYEHGFTGQVAQSDDAKYVKGYNLGMKQAGRVVAGTNVKLSARIK